jgi:hypothetical protein
MRRGLSRFGASSSLDFDMNYTWLAQSRKLAGLAGALLGWRADEFWAATPEELGCVLAALSDVAGGRGAGDAPPDAAVMARLMERFPDG